MLVHYHLMGCNYMRQLTLTNDQFDVLYDILQDTVDVIKDDLIEYEDDISTIVDSISFFVVNVHSS